jgi:hypothetical protein
MVGATSTLIRDERFYVRELLQKIRTFAAALMDN